MTTRTVISGRSALKSYVRSNLSELRRSNCLIIGSNLRDDGGSASYLGNNRRELEEFQKRLGRKVEEVSFTTRMQYQLRQIESTISSAFPTMADVNSCVELSRRSGVELVLGVGSGSAMDLAKAVSMQLHQHHDTAVQLVLCPATLGATMAAMSNVTLLLSPHEEALLPPNLHSTTSTKSHVCNNSTAVHVNPPTVLIDDSFITAPTWLQPTTANNTSISKSHRDAETYSGGSSPTLMDASLSSLVIALDAAHAADLSNDTSIDFPIDQLHATILHSLTAIHILSASNIKNAIPTELMEQSQPHVLAALIHAGQFLSFGLMEGQNNTIHRVRSIPLALSSALLPRYFPHANLLSFIASIFPSLLPLLDHYHNTNKHDDNNSYLQQAINVMHETIPTLSSTSTTSHPMLTLSKDTPLTDLTQHYLLHNNIFIPTMSSFAEGAPDLNQMMDRIDANAALINCQDIDDHYPTFLQTILSSSLSR